MVSYTESEKNIAQPFIKNIKIGFEKQFYKHSVKLV